MRVSSSHRACALRTACLTLRVGFAQRKSSPVKRDNRCHISLGVSTPVRTRDSAGSIAEHLRATFQLRGGWPPATRQPVLEQLGRAGSMIPHGDRRDRPESRRVKDQEAAAIQREHDIMSVLILRDDLLDLARRRSATGPHKDVCQGEKLRKLGSQLAKEL